MKSSDANLSALNRNIIRIAVVTGLILMIPLVAMQFTAEVDWNLFDFVIMGTLIFGTGLAYELISRSIHKEYRLVVVAVLFVLLFLVWAELAVGVFGAPFAGS